MTIANKHIAEIVERCVMMQTYVENAAMRINLQLSATHIHIVCHMCVRVGCVRVRVCIVRIRTMSKNTYERIQSRNWLYVYVNVSK